MIPVQRPYLGENELNAVKRVFDSRWLGMGSATKEFEEQLQKYIGAKHVIAVNTGTSALHLALEALGLNIDDEIIVPSLTFVASVQAILSARAKPVFCDVHIETLNINVGDVARRITKRTKAIMPVHYGGLPCDMDALLSLARSHGLPVIEDAAHAFGSSYGGRKIGSISDITCFSFDPIKNITCGEGGAIATDNDEIADRIIPKRILGIVNDTWSRYRNQRNWLYEVVTPGFRYHLSNINAVIGLEQLKRMEAFRRRKCDIVQRYDKAFTDLKRFALLRHDLEETFPFFYVVRVLNGHRDQFVMYMKECGIGTGVHWVPNHLQPLFTASRVSLPVTERAFEEIVTLPLFFEMTDPEVDQVISAVQSFAPSEVA